LDPPIMLRELLVRREDFGPFASTERGKTRKKYVLKNPLINGRSTGPRRKSRPQKSAGNSCRFQKGERGGRRKKGIKISPRLFVRRGHASRGEPRGDGNPGGGFNVSSGPPSQGNMQSENWKGGVGGEAEKEGGKNVAIRTTWVTKSSELSAGATRKKMPGDFFVLDLSVRANSQIDGEEKMNEGGTWKGVNGHTAGVALKLMTRGGDSSISRKGGVERRDSSSAARTKGEGRSWFRDRTTWVCRTTTWGNE